MRRKFDLSDVVMAAVVLFAIVCAGFVAYAKFRAMTEFDAWCQLRGGQVVGNDGDVCVDPEGKVILQ